MTGRWHRLLSLHNSSWLGLLANQGIQTTNAFCLSASRPSQSMVLMGHTFSGHTGSETVLNAGFSWRTGAMGTFAGTFVLLVETFLLARKYGAANATPYQLGVHILLSWRLMRTVWRYWRKGTRTDLRSQGHSSGAFVISGTSTRRTLSSKPRVICSFTYPDLIPSEGLHVTLCARFPSWDTFKTMYNPTLSTNVLLHVRTTVQLQSMITSFTCLQSKAIISISSTFHRFIFMTPLSKKGYKLAAIYWINPTKIAFLTNWRNRITTKQLFPLCLIYFLKCNLNISRSKRLFGSLKTSSLILQPLTTLLFRHHLLYGENTRMSRFRPSVVHFAQFPRWNSMGNLKKSLDERQPRASFAKHQSNAQIMERVELLL